MTSSGITSCSASSIARSVPGLIVTMSKARAALVHGDDERQKNREMDRDRNRKWAAHEAGCAAKLWLHRRGWAAQGKGYDQYRAEHDQAENQTGRSQAETSRCVKQKMETGRIPEISAMFQTSGPE